ncbi:type II secretion system protein N [Salinicola halophilus]|uniref:type II secretion system protein N n=1 Tax=Salinicola halophilus TaxID=184065 RepID=UPI000DA1E93A|nr:type II secretion system protein N [Salinicola halophilus]
MLRFMPLSSSWPTTLGRWLLWCLVAWLAARVIAGSAQLIWQLAHPPVTAGHQVASPPPHSLPPTADRAWSSSPAETTTTDLALTQLPLSFLGIVRATPVSRSLVILDTPEGQRVRMAGEEIFSDVVLERITETGLILDNRGTRERLPWPQSEAAHDGIFIVEQRVASPSRRIEARWPEVALHQAFGEDYRTRLLAEPQRFSPHLAVVPVVENGRLQGYRLAPGDDATLFDALPFERGDLITAIGERPIAEFSPADVAGAVGDLPVSLQLVRNGAPLILVLEPSS